MRVAFFSPLPPARSGIADYSEALLESLRSFADVEVFSREDAAFDAAKFDVALYHIGNNGFHAFVYETALRHPGVVALHEANLHHLITDLTIRRGDWEAYIRECEYNGGQAAREWGQRARKLEVGPDYEGVKMTRRLLESARGVVVHSAFMRDEVRASGYQGPVAVIPHGAWIPPGDRNAYRERLGIDEASPLIGVFGFLKPYKRIPESLRAFRRLVKLAPNAKMILAGEEHPDLELEPLIRSLDLSGNVRRLGFTPTADFAGYIAACDIVLNLRFPTVGESSGTLMRALGMGKAVLVSDVGSFSELPGDVCLKVTPGPAEEDLIFEYLNLLVSRPDVARGLGSRAREYVERECAWPLVARRYAEFMESVAGGGAPPAPAEPEATEAHEAPAPVEATEDPNRSIEYLRTWATEEESRKYLETHQTRLVKTLEMIPPGSPCDRVLEMGAYLQITPALRARLGYGEVRGCYYGEAGHSDRRSVTSSAGETFCCEIDHFNAEKDRFPYPDAYFSTVLCCELIEHLAEDPMHMMCEINRILKMGGRLLLTTPNIASLRAVHAVLQGYHPGFYHSYVKPPAPGVEPEARHNREYAPREIHNLLVNSGFEVERLETGEFRELPHPEHGWVEHLLKRYGLNATLRGDGIYALGRKNGPVRERYPEWLYS